MESNNVHYPLTVTTANYNQGILNIPTRFSPYFGEHGSQVSVQIEDRQPFFRNIDRNNVRNKAPRISSGFLSDYFQEKGQMGHTYQITIAQNQIFINPHASN